MRRAAARGADVDVHVLPVDGRERVGGDGLDVSVVLRHGGRFRSPVRPGSSWGVGDLRRVVGRARRLRTVSAQTLKSIGLAAKLESTAALNIFSLDLRVVAGLPSLLPWRAVVRIYKIFLRPIKHHKALRSHTCARPMGGATTHQRPKAPRGHGCLFIQCQRRSATTAERQPCGADRMDRSYHACASRLHSCL